MGVCVGVCVGACVCVLCFTRVNVADEKHDERGITDMYTTSNSHKSTAPTTLCQVPHHPDYTVVRLCMLLYWPTCSISMGQANI